MKIGVYFTVNYIQDQILQTHRVIYRTENTELNNEQMMRTGNWKLPLSHFPQCIYIHSWELNMEKEIHDNIIVELLETNCGIYVIPNKLDLL